MDTLLNEKDSSDDEVFVGKLSLKEVKKRLLLDSYSTSLTCAKSETEDSDSSLKLIETCSEPELRSGISLNDSQQSRPSIENHRSINFTLNDQKATNNWDLNSENDSFLEMEKMVSDLLLHDNKENQELDNTLDVVEYILNNAPHSEECIKQTDKSENTKSTDCNKAISQDKDIEHTSIVSSQILRTDVEKVKLGPISQHTPKVKGNTLDNNCKSSSKFMTVSSKTTDKLGKSTVEASPNNNVCHTDYTFKTPKSAISMKNNFLTPKSTPKCNSYQHITSPVATYIKNGPQVPLLRDVRPKKPLSAVSSIPKPVKILDKKVEKANINLPAVAYKSAKNVKVVKMPNEERLPENQWAKKISSTLPKAVVLSHDHRENKYPKKITEPQPEDSFANLTLHQADLSVCTQKTAYNKLNTLAKTPSQ